MPLTPRQPSAKDRVLAWVREKNPQTMELKLGTRLRYRCNGNVEYWYPSKDGNGKTKARDSYAKKRVTIYQHEKQWEEIVWFGVGLTRQVPEKWNGKWAMVTHITDGTRDVKYLDLEIIGSDMGLQELLIALALGKYFHSILIAPSATSHKECFILSDECTVQFDLTKNLHSQAPEFYEALLPLLP